MSVQRKSHYLHSRPEAHRALQLASGEVRFLADRIRAGTAVITARRSNPWHTAIPDIVEGLPLDEAGRRRCIHLGQMMALAYLWSVADHLYAVSACLDDRPLFAVGSLSRIAVEAACVCAWLNEDGVTPQTVFLRHIKKQKDTLSSEQRNIKAMLRSASGSQADELAAMREENEGWIRECRIAISRVGDLPDTKMPSATKVVGAVLEQVNLTEFPEISYRANSAFVHSDPYILFNSLDVIGPRPELEGAQMSMTVGSKLAPVMEALLAVIAMLKTIDHSWANDIELDGIEGIVDRLSSAAREFGPYPSERM